ncbi:MAG: hypothetical protein HYV60_09290 [Planctomycetia bacterium]|nr:hypothetical protein [Planctomycetia bacterium]
MRSANRKRSIVLAAAVLLLAGLLAKGVLTGNSLAESTVTIDEQLVQFQLRPAGDGVEASVSFDADAMHFRRAVCKQVPGATHAAARRARFEFDPDQRRARFVLDGGGVTFVQSDYDVWHIEPWISQLADRSS